MDTTEDFEGHPMEEGNAIDGYTMVEEMVPVQSGTMYASLNISSKN